MTAYTPIYNLPYVEASDLVASYPTVSEELAENVETAIAGSGGLSLISPTSIANSGGSASSSNGTTTFSGVSSISLNSVFSATYENYRLVASIYAASATPPIHYRLRASGSDDTSSNYAYQRVVAYSGTSIAAQGAFPNSLGLLGYVSTYDGCIITADITNPAVAARTTLWAKSVVMQPSTLDVDYTGNGHYQTTAYDGITILPASSTISGTIRIYGYKGA